ncbi:MAG: hypothetical protein HON98_02710 [Chloroflexi bacterium]|nr:hypothetical protein [Chloroflexota bacterium]MBT4001900.1 hypothetical protein [Chloroflexota bacterium]MBT4305455.1 hypothetical protein [Chloroflexota bacterium]MBT4682152.1 hypothetical protein [Chloroflexota bacterium]MBT4754574.1 hypothetical protein [Chloroflexota bacterium]
MAQRTFNCNSCNAPLPKYSTLCEYCGMYSSFSPEELEKIGAISQPDFGISNSKYLIITVLGAAIIYALGWRFEDLDYLLDERSVVIWGSGLPLWLAISAFFWKTNWGEYLPGISISLPIFLFHMLIIWLIKGNINDDGVGISAAFGAGALFGWVAGRLFHKYIRKIRKQANSE